MLKLFAVADTRKKVIDQDMKQFLFHHPYIKMFLYCIAMPIPILVTVSAICFAVMFPISFFMGWM